MKNVFTNGTRVYGLGWAACIDESKNKRFLGKKRDEFIFAEFSNKIQKLILEIKTIKRQKNLILEILN